MKVGFIGLGDQGQPIAQRIASAGYDLTVWARSSGQLQPFAGSAVSIAATPEELGARCEVVGVCVFDAHGVLEVLFGGGGHAGVVPAMVPGGIVMVHSTLAPSEIVHVADRAAEYGVRVLDAPVSGGRDGALAGELVVMVGGDEDVFETCRPLLAAFAATTVRLGPVGAGQVAKLVNNSLLAAHLALATDAFELGERFGVERDMLSRVLVAGSGRSYGLQVLAGAGPLAGLAQSQLRPTVGKDVRLLGGELRLRSDADGLLLAAAEHAISVLDAAAGVSAGPPPGDDQARRPVPGKSPL